MKLWAATPAQRKLKQSIERCKKEHAISETAHLLMENAIKALMQLNGVDRDTAERAIRDVMGGAVVGEAGRSANNP
jgi:hypothetical protein